MICPNPACRRVWRYTGDAEWICCPSCHRKFRRPAPVVEVLGEQIATDTTCDVCGEPGHGAYPCRIDGEAAFVCATCLNQN